MSGTVRMGGQLKMLTKSMIVAVGLGLLVSQIFAARSSGAARPAAGVRLVETGEFHGDEVSARTGERWLGLYVSPGSSALVASTVRVEWVHDPIVDENPSVKTGKKVRVRQRSVPIFLVRGGDGLRPGPVTTVHDEPRSLNGQSDVRLKLAGMEYRLRVLTQDRRPEEAIMLDDARLVLSHGRTREVLYALGGKGDETEAWWNLLWAGDLDGDGRLDLYIEVSDHYNVSERKLFLSSGTRKGRLVREVAEFRTVGC